jgi:hypothetical protein
MHFMVPGNCVFEIPVPSDILVQRKFMVFIEANFDGVVNWRKR